MQTKARVTEIQLGWRLADCVCYVTQTSNGQIRLRIRILDYDNHGNGGGASCNSRQKW